MSDIQPLNYALPPPLHRRRIFRRWIYVVVLLGVVASGWWWAPPAWRRVELLYWQHLCMVYTPAPDAAMYDDSSHLPGTIPEEWSRFYNLVSPPGFSSGGTVFLHELKKRNGESRLVAIDVCETPNVNFTAVRVFVTANFFHNPVETDSEGDSFLFQKSLKIYPGIPDRVDSTHFTVRAVNDGKEEFYEGWLQDDDKVIFVHRKNGTR